VLVALAMFKWRNINISHTNHGLTPEQIHPVRKELTIVYYWLYGLAIVYYGLAIVYYGLAIVYCGLLWSGYCLLWSTMGWLVATKSLLCNGLLITLLHRLLKH
jgi:hypothetical protein